MSSRFWVRRGTARRARRGGTAVVATSAIDANAVVLGIAADKSRVDGKNLVVIRAGHGMPCPYKCEAFAFDCELSTANVDAFARY